MTDFDESVFWPEFKAAGMLKFATVKQKGGARDVWIGFNTPDVPRFNGEGRSRDFEMEYQAADLTNLAEGDAVTIWADEDKSSGTKYVVREAPFVSDIPAQGTDGYFMRALLTKV